MALNFSFEVDPEGITVPYPAITDEIRCNRGFIDLRKEPEKAREIAEAAGSPALRRLLVRIAKSAGPLFTIGCDLGAHQEPAEIVGRVSEIAGGYIQFASVNYDTARTEAYSSLAHSLCQIVESRVGRDRWELRCLGRWVDFKFEGEPQGLRPSLWIWFFATSTTPRNALRSRERLIEAIHEGVTSTVTSRFFP